MIALGSLGGGWSYPYAVSNDGQVVGWSSLAGETVHAFSWTRHGGMVDLGALGPTSVAMDVSPNGMVVGSSWTGVPNEDRAVLWIKMGLGP